MRAWTDLRRGVLSEADSSVMVNAMWSRGQRFFAELDLESVLECMDLPAMALGEDFVIRATNRAFRREFAPDRNIQGRFCYEVTHEFEQPCPNYGKLCPLNGALWSCCSHRAVHVHFTPRGAEHVEIRSHPLETRSTEGGRLALETFRRLEPTSPRSETDKMVGRSESFINMLAFLSRVAPRDTPVLLLGESGTGKELAAQAVHQLSPRCDKPFVPVDCSGLTETLFESELFGHEKGAFTGASGLKRGLVELAEGGTLFLDEVGDIPPAMQVKLLRLLETGMFRRVGSIEQQRVDFRLVCATHRNLERWTQEGRFRTDLYYRIGVFPVRLPPLRERTEDLKILAEALLHRLDLGVRHLQPEVLESLAKYRFPGNVRELRNILERACLLADGRPVGIEHLPAACRIGSTARSSSEGSLEEIESRCLMDTAARFRGSRKDLAKQLRISERALYRRLARARKVLAARSRERACEEQCGGPSS